MSAALGNVFQVYFCACNPGSTVALVYPLGRNSIIPLFFRVIENLAKRPHSNYTRRTTLLLLLWANSHKYSLPATSVTTGKKINDKCIILLCLVLQTVVFFCTYVRFNANFSQTVMKKVKSSTRSNYDLTSPLQRYKCVLKETFWDLPRT